MLWCQPWGTRASIWVRTDECLSLCSCCLVACNGSFDGLPAPDTYSLVQWSHAGAGQYKQVDSVGTANLIEAAKKAGVKKFVLLTSLLTNAKAVGQADNNNYKFLNVRSGSKQQALQCCTV